MSFLDQFINSKASLFLILQDGSLPYLVVYGGNIFP